MIQSGCVQDSQHCGGPAEKAQLALIGGNVLVVSGSGSEEVAQLVMAATEPRRGERALEAAHGSVSALEAAVILLDPIIQVAAGPMPHLLALLPNVGPAC